MSTNRLRIKILTSDHTLGSYSIAMWLLVNKPGEITTFRGLLFVPQPEIAEDRAEDRRE